MYGLFDDPNYQYPIIPGAVGLKPRAGSGVGLRPMDDSQAVGLFGDPSSLPVNFAPAQAQAQAQPMSPMDALNARMTKGMNSPAFTLGMGMLAASGSPDGWATGANVINQTRQIAAMEAYRKALMEHQQAQLAEEVRAHNMTNDVAKGTLAETGRHNLSEEGLLERQRAVSEALAQAQVPLYNAQALNAQAEAKLHGQQGDKLIQDQAAQQWLLQNLPGMMNGQMPQGAPGGAQPMPQVPQGGGMSPVAPGAGLQPGVGGSGLKPTAIQMTETGGNPNLVGAAGERGSYQVMGKTAVNPGFGVTPASNNSTGELDRVGQDYYQALQNKYQNPLHTAVAYNWGPGKADKWIANGADPAKLPPTVRQYVGTTMLYNQLGYPLPGQQQVAAGGQSQVVPPTIGSPAAAQSGMMAPRVSNEPSINLAKAGTLAAAALDPKELPGAFGRLSEANKPIPIPSGGYVSTPNGTVYMPDPLREAEGQRDTQRLVLQARENAFKYGTGAPGAAPTGLTPEQSNQVLGASIKEDKTHLMERYEILRDLPNRYSQLDQAKALIPQSYTGSTADQKLQATRLFNSTLGPLLGIQYNPDKVANTQVLNSLMFQEVMPKLRQMDPTPTQPQQKLLMQNLGNFTNDPKAMAKVIDILQETMRKEVAQHNNTVDQFEKNAPGMLPIDRRIHLPAPAQPQQQAAAQAAPAGAAMPQGQQPMSLDDYFKQKYKKGGR